ncbi:class I SAM-dependent DNA methyltransferase [Pseudocnuella soli]|uniref:class I SAM-dependent DNA methyltransferase n=1 Tax=Pseudocnuella soli TaxID=2502779 RepID=UPI00104E534A|nr:DNA methyltransferase [Pseudocnuella soli]
MPLSWNEIKSRALAFSKEWETEWSEDAEAKSFWDDFFNVFGISRRRVATFEQQVKKIDAKTGFIDLLWKGQLLIEHKSRGRSLDKAYQQAKDYFPGLKEAELPRYILVSDFEKFRLYDLDSATHHEFALAKLVEHVHLFGFIAGYQKRTYKEQDPVNIAAAELMGRLHDKLKANGYTGHQLEVYLVRLVFLLFADDTNIWEKGIFFDYLDLNTKEDGSDLALHLSQLFEVLNTPEGQRLKNLDESLAAFPYINGKLFAEHLRTAAFDSEMRKTLMDCCALDWGTISPAIFGSLFQSVMDEKARRNLGAHYTSEKNILKLIKPLFLDELYAEFEKVKSSKPKLLQFHDKLSKLRFLDPACGCGNFLIVAYRELRLLELEVIKTLLFTHEKIRAEVAASAGVDIALLAKCNVDRFYGIEYEEFPAQIAQVAMWLIDHQMNMKVSETFGGYYPRIPLTKSATIKHANALRVDWQSLIDEVGATYDYILGNPPFVGKSLQNVEQKKDMEAVFTGVNGAGVLDYVTAWYVRAAQYMQQSIKTKTAFVSTNSISQGEQVSILWNELFHKYKCKIHFAHRTFSWRNEARGNAAVHVVIIGFANFDIDDKRIYEYEGLRGEPHEIDVKNINPYLVEGADTFLVSRKKSICNAPATLYGSKPVDDGNFFFTDKEKNDFLKEEPNAKKFIKPFLSAKEFLDNERRWCLWLKDISPTELKSLAKVKERVENVRIFREASSKEATRKLAAFPTLFAEQRQPISNYVLIPIHTSENRQYIPFGFFTPDFIVGNSCTALINCTLSDWGVLSSKMHMVWVKYTCGRIKSDYRYSNDIVYNNFPWPEAPTDKQTAAVETTAQAVLDARAQFPTASLADLYDPNTMPPVLVKAHRALDKAVDLCYRPQPFPSESKRIEFLFELYDKYTAGLFVPEKPRRKKP